jgi:phosphohistidine phosphatase
MMKNLKRFTIVRHAKSSWEYDGVSDLDRPLNNKGILDSNRMAGALDQEKYFPDKIISSPANRALHTAVIFARVMEYPFYKITIDQTIYGAYEDEIIRMLKGMDNDWRSVMIFGHNPVVTNLTNMFLKKSIDNLPTTGVASFLFNTEYWDEISPASVKTEFLDYPKKHKK